MKAAKHCQFLRPFVKADGTRINCVQMWDYHPDGTITIHILYAYEREGEIIRQDVYEEHLTPFSIQIALSALEEMGYTDIVVKPCPWFGDAAFEDIGWYCLRAKKL